MTWACREIKIDDVAPSNLTKGMPSNAPLETTIPCRRSDNIYIFKLVYIPLCNVFATYLLYVLQLQKDFFLLRLYWKSPPKMMLSAVAIDFTVNNTIPVFNHY